MGIEKLSETDLIVLQIASQHDGLTTAFRTGGEAFRRIGRTYSPICTEWASRRFAKLRNCGFVEQPRRGHWRVTDEGRQFLAEKEAA
jgi:restriction endonuclease Mrr